ncbi:unnamed protein product [Caenorhabditis sp. 36 PRJEB53466]|nr:unnamed protein product [Caenorhabditis sp. 36 PRJEB53466]
MKCNIMQGWYGEHNFITESQIEIKVDTAGSMTVPIVKFDIREVDGTTVTMIMPMQHFTQLLYFDAKTDNSHPTALIFRLNTLGFSQLRKSVPGLFKKWKKVNAKERKAFADTVMFVIDSAGTSNLPYSMKTFAEFWQSHLIRHRGSKKDDVEDLIVNICEVQFCKIYTQFGLKSVDSKSMSGSNQNPIKIFQYDPEVAKDVAEQSKRVRTVSGSDSEEPSEKRAKPDFDEEEEEMLMIEREFRRQNGQESDSENEYDETSCDKKVTEKKQ